MSVISIRDKVIAFAVSLLRQFYPDIPVIQAKQDIAVQYPQYIVVDLLAERSLGNDETWDIEDEIINVNQLVEATLNVQAYGSGSIEMLAQLPTQVYRPSIVDICTIANIAITDIGSVNDISEALDDVHWLERASVDLTVSYDRQAVDNPGWFDTVLIHSIHVVDILPEPSKKQQKLKVEFIRDTKEN